MTGPHTPDIPAPVNCGRFLETREGRGTTTERYRPDRRQGVEDTNRDKLN